MTSARCVAKLYSVGCITSAHWLPRERKHILRSTAARKTMIGPQPAVIRESPLLTVANLLHRDRLDQSLRNGTLAHARPVAPSALMSAMKHWRPPARRRQGSSLPRAGFARRSSKNVSWRGPPIPFRADPPSRQSSPSGSASPSVRDHAPQHRVPVWPRSRQHVGLGSEPLRARCR